MRTLCFLAFCTSGMLLGSSTQYRHPGQHTNSGRTISDTSVRASDVAAQIEQLTTRQVEIISEPPGARIEVNDKYIGDAPITTTLRCAPDGRFFENTTIRALPIHPGDYVQSKLFFGGFSSSSNSLNNTIPSRIFFDMHLGPVSRDINVNIQ